MTNTSVKIKVLIVLNALERGGTENQVMALLKALDGNDYERTLLLLHAVDPPGREFEDELVRNGIRVDAPGRLFRWRWLVYVHAFIRYLGLQLRERFDIVHFFLPASYIVGGFAAMIAGPKCRVMSRRSLNNYQKGHGAVMLLEKFLHARMSVITGNSEAVCAQLREEVADRHADKITLVHNGIELPSLAVRAQTRAQVRKDYGLQENDLVLLVVANLFRYKGHADLIDALGAIKHDLPESWTVVCLGENRGAMDNAVLKGRENGIAEHIRWLGSVDGQTVKRFNLAADIFILPSHQEGLPNAVLEAQACGLPVVATHVGGVPDIIDSPRTGLMVPPRNPGLLGGAILALVKDPARRRAIAEAASSRIVQYFQLPDMANRYKALYDRVLREGAKPLHAEIVAGYRTSFKKRFAVSMIGALSIGLLAVALMWVDLNKVVSHIRAFPASGLGWLFVVLYANILVTSGRFHMIVKALYKDIRWSWSLRASLAGHLASLALPSIVGQIIGRHGVLAGQNISPSSTASIFLYERMITLLSGGLLALAGGAYLLSNEIRLLRYYNDPITPVPIVIAASLVLSLLFFRSEPEEMARRLARLVAWRSVLKSMMITGLISVCGQALVIAGFVIVLYSLNMGTSIPLISVISASAVVSFMAALPISVNGWGIREVSAIGIFGLLGVDPADALFISVTIGLLSTVVLISWAPVLAWIGRSSPPENTAGAIADALPPEHDGSRDNSARAIWIELLPRLLVTLLTILTAALILFYPRIEIYGTSIGVNLADPIAIIGALVFMLHLASHRCWPVWRISFTNAWVILASVTMIVSYLIGYFDFGATAWATVKRLGGWPVLLAYAATGAFFASMTSEADVQHIIRKMVLCLVIILCAEITLRITGTFLRINALASINEPLNGFVTNRNAFAFSAAILLAAVLAYPRVMTGDGRSIPLALITGLLLLGLVFIQSKTGIGVAVVLMAVTCIFNLEDRKAILGGLAVCLGLFALAVGTVYVAVDFGEPILDSIFLEQNDAFQIASFFRTLRWDTMKDGLILWSSAPFFGAGLGKFILESTHLYGRPVVIHNSFIWLLVETGLFGAVIFVSQFVRVFLFSVKRGVATPSSPQSSELFIARFLFLALLVFGLFSVAHDVMYQRIFWFLMGLTLAVPGSLKVVKTAPAARGGGG